jgi:hypothetical protein
MRPPRSPDVPVPRSPGIQKTTFPASHQNGTFVEQPITCPLRLSLIDIVAICAVLLVLLLIFLPPLRAFSKAITVAIQTHQDIISLAVMLAIVLIIVRLICRGRRIPANQYGLGGNLEQ